MYSSGRGPGRGVPCNTVEVKSLHLEFHVSGVDISHRKQCQDLIPTAIAIEPLSKQR